VVMVEATAVVVKKFQVVQQHIQREQELHKQCWELIRNNG